MTIQELFKRRHYAEIRVDKKVLYSDSNGKYSVVYKPTVSITGKILLDTISIEEAITELIS